MSWRGPALDGDQRDLAAMLSALATDRDLVLDDDPDTVAALMSQLAELGVWTLGAAEEAGGAGADRTTTNVVLETLGRHWPALGWASVQAQAAIEVLAADPRFAELVAALHAGRESIAVVEAAAEHVRLTWDGNELTGYVDRIDAAHPAPHLLVLDGPDAAVLVLPGALGCRRLRRTGLGGAQTSEVRVAGSPETVPATVHRLDGVDGGSVRSSLRLGAAAVAAGIAGAASDDALRYAGDRQQFGAPLTALPTVRQSLAEQAGRTAVALRAASAGAATEVDASAVLRAACESAIEVAAGALQSHGGYGYLTEYAAERRLRDAISLRAAVDASAQPRYAGRALVGLAAHDTIGTEQR